LEIINDSDNSTLITISPEPTQYNTTLYVNPLETETDNESGVNCVGNDVRLNQNHNLSHSQSYTDTVSNNTYTCAMANSCYQNISYNAASGETWHNGATNITITCAAATSCAINKNLTLDYGESYQNNTIGFYIYAPNYPYLNATINIEPTESYNNTDLGLSVSCSDISMVEESLTLTCGQSYSNSYGTIISASECANITKELELGEIINLPEFGIWIKSKDKPSILRVLYEGESYENQEFGIAVSCQASMQDKLDWCTQINETPIGQLWEQINITENYTCNSYAYQCLDGFESCTLDEKLGGQYGLIQCHNRIDSNYVTTINAQIDRANIATTDLENKKTELTSCQTAQTNYLEVLEWIVLGIVVGSVGIGIFSTWTERKDAEGATP
jgi:hypothetical protein